MTLKTETESNPSDGLTQPAGNPQPPHAPPSDRSFIRRMIISYGYLILKNIIGWALIWGSIPAGLLVPGPGGLPMFVIGFAMISFPGKRTLTARALYGKPISPDSLVFKRAAQLLSIFAPAGLILYLRTFEFIDPLSSRQKSTIFVAIYLAMVVLLWILLPYSRLALNWAMRVLPKIRRKVRPWMRKKGIDLLPPRRRRRPITSEQGHAGHTRDPDPEILEIHERHFTRLRAFWTASWPWIKRLATVTLAVLIFYYIFQKVRGQWGDVRERLALLEPWRVAIAVVMFSMFLAFRALSWRRILVGFGHRLPYAAAIRVWCASEIARYLPGGIWQVVGRVYLVRPYGVSGPVCSASQLLELAAFLLANVIVAVMCLAYYGAKVAPEARIGLYAAMALVPVLGLLLHPKIFYGLANNVLARIGKPLITERLGGWPLTRLLFRLVLALLWQSLALYLLVAPLLELEPSHWWTLAGAYCLAWSAGFLMGFWAPGGIGVRELVFVAAMQVVLPKQVKDALPVHALLGFLAVLLRLWTTAGELLLLGIAHLLDYRGAMGRNDAPGRVQLEP